MTLPSAASDRTLLIYLSLSQYPVLSTAIRARMRRELFNRGIINQQEFEVEAREKAIRSQALEGLHNPFSEEAADIWELRLSKVREHLTDFYFAYNLPYDLFEKIVRDTLAERGAGELQPTFNPELAPQNLLFDQAIQLEKLPPEERKQHDARLQEIKVVLIRTMISDQLAYLKIAKDWFTISDLNEIRTHKIGQGKIGGKSAGMLLAARILADVGDEDMRNHLRQPESYYIGADMTYTFMALNGLMKWGDQKYKLEEQIRAEYPRIQEEFTQGEFPSDILDKFRDLLVSVGKKPLIVRSSSLLEDNFGTSFAGKYESFFCPNQGTFEENLADFTNAIARIYASMLNPDALLYRRAKGLQDYDERMALLIQVVEGERYGRYYLPQAAGVAFSRNLYRWAPQISRDAGFVRLVWGLGTRAVDRVGNDYPRLVALSHPLLHPESGAKEIRHYSQHYVDLINLEANTFETLPVEQVLRSNYPALRYIAQIDQGDYLAPVRILIQEGDHRNLVLTFDELLRRTPLAQRLTRILQTLEKHYLAPVDTEFTLRVVDGNTTRPEVEISLLQCRPQSHLREIDVSMPANIPTEDIIFSTQRMAPEGRVTEVEVVLFVSPEGYYALSTSAERIALGRVIGLINSLLKKTVFICVGPGRWGTSTPDLGVRVGYADIYNARALVELTGSGIGAGPEASFGTHFFQDLVESNIFPLAIYLDDPEVVFNRSFFYDTPNHLIDLLPDHQTWSSVLRVIEVADYRMGTHLELVMDADAGCSVAFLMEG